MIESIFGKYKHTASTNQLIGVPTTSLEVPLYPMDIAQLTDIIIPSVEDILGKEIDAWKQAQYVENQDEGRNQSSEQPTLVVALTSESNTTSSTQKLCVETVF